MIETFFLKTKSEDKSPIFGLKIEHSEETEVP